MNISILYIFLASALVGFTVTDAVFHPPRQEILLDGTDKVHMADKADETNEVAKASEVDETDEADVVDKVVKPIKTKRAKKPKKVNKVVEADLVDKVDEADVVDKADDADETGLIAEQDIDVQDSTDDAEEKRGFAVDGDLRLSYVTSGEDFEDAIAGDSNLLRLRWRLRSVWGVTEKLRGVARLAGICSTEDCSHEFIMQPNIPTTTGLSDGQFTIDELFLQWFRTEKFNLAVGRMATKFVARGGVYAKSLDRNDSNNQRVNWTDGVLATYQAQNGWKSSMVLQYNSAAGPSNVRHYPLDFSDDRSRVTTFLAFENVLSRDSGEYIVQRALDISYLPSSLLKNGTADGLVEDYWAFVARGAARWPARAKGSRLRFSSELGYAPVTQTKTAAGFAGAGEVNGLAWNVTASIMEFLPKHSIGINYARTEAGWLISPQYSDNEELFEVRYMWRPTATLTLDVRGRLRYELRQTITGDSDSDPFDFYARLSWSFTAKRLAK